MGIEIRGLAQREPRELALWQARVFPYSEVNASILGELEAAEPFWELSHPVNGRWENVYFPKGHAVQTVQLLDVICAAAERVAGKSLRVVHNPANCADNGWWINRALPGEQTGVHDHSIHAALSGVYYLCIPSNSGSIAFCPHEGEEVQLEPEEGALLLFPPRLKHRVGKNKSDSNRISLAFNLYPVGA